MDHLGNNRIIFNDKDESGVIDDPSEIISRTNYYPFGKEFSTNNSGGHRQKYNYMENGFYDNSIDLNFATFRTLDANLGLWMQVDSTPGQSRAKAMNSQLLNSSNSSRSMLRLSVDTSGNAVD